MQITLGQQCNVGEKPTVIPYIYINRHAGTPEKHIPSHRVVLIVIYIVCVCVCFLPIHSGHQVRWTYQPGSHRRKVTQDF